MILGKYPAVVLNQEGKVPRAGIESRFALLIGTFASLLLKAKGF
jgi:hypothetical protein